MVKSLKLYTLVDGVNDTPFPDKESQIEISDFTYDAKRMGGAPTITATVMYATCLDDVWTDNVYAEFNGEKYFLKQTPTSSYSNEDARYKHEVDLISERFILENVYFYDVIASDATSDKPVSNSSNVVFFGDIEEFAKRMNYSLQYANLQTIDADGSYVSGYRVIIDEGVETEGKLMSFDNQFMANVLQEIYNTYNIPYYFVGKEIHIGDTPNKITTPFQYGVDEALLSITKANANYKVVNRATGIGSPDNIPYYYPNQTERGDLEVLLNDQSGKAAIKNNSKIAKFGLTDKLVYNITDQYFAEFYTSPNMDNSFIEEVGETALKWYMQINIPFTIPVLATQYDTKISIKCQDGKSFSPSIALYKGSEHLYTKYGTTVNPQTGWVYESAEDLLGGDYHITITMETEYPSIIDPNNPNDPNNIYSNLTDPNKSDLLSYLTKFFTISINQQDNTVKQYWAKGSKDGHFVSLDDIGVAINADVTLSADDELTLKQVRYIAPQTNLMPSIYRETFGAERFYNALNDWYTKPDTNPVEWYSFNNPYIEGKPKEQIVSFEDIKPTIVGMKNADGNLIGMFTEFAYDEDDNDETEEIEGTTYYKHPFFFGKLRKFDGANGFNLFDHSIEEEEMVVSFTDGSCGGCEFTIVVSEEAQENLVQVYEADEYDSDEVLHKKGSLKYDKNGNVLCGREHYQSKVVAQEIQNDTINNEVWVALRKDDATFGVIMPNATNNYKPNASTTNADGTYADDGDKFVILHIDLPKAYITDAEDRLKYAILDYMANNNDEKFNFSITFSRIYLAENPDVYSALNENTHLQIVYNNRVYPLYVSSYSYKASSSDALPEISVELSDTLTIVQNALQNAISEVKSDMFTVMETFYNPSSSNAEDEKVSKKYLRKDIPDTASGVITFKNGAVFGKSHGIDSTGGATLYSVITDDDKTGITQASSKFNSDPMLGYGYGIEHQDDGTYKLTIDHLVARRSMTVTELVIQEYKSVGGVLVVSHANGEISDVQLSEDGTTYKIYLKEWDEQPKFVAGDFMRCSKWDDESLTYTSYWVAITDVVEAGDSGYLQVLASSFESEGVYPEIGDNVVQFGSTDEDRQGLILISVEGGKPRMDAYDGINSNTADALADALKARFGKLDGIVDNGTELNGYGIYADNLYLGLGKSASKLFQVLSDRFSSEVFNSSGNMLVETNQGAKNWAFSSGGVLECQIYDAEDGAVAFEIFNGSGASQEHFIYPVPSILIEKGKTYTVSFEIFLTDGGVFESSGMVATISHGSTYYTDLVVCDNTTAVNTWVKMTATLTGTNDGADSGVENLNLRLMMRKMGTFSSMLIRNLMLNEGDTALPYTDSNYRRVSQIEQTAEKISLKVDNLDDDLLATGIDIENKQITLTADNVEVKNNEGTTTALLDANGKLSTAVIDASSLYVQRIIALDRNVTPHQVVSTINAIGNDGIYYTHYPVTYDSDGVADEDTVYAVVEGYKIGHPASANGYDKDTDSIATVYDAYGNVRWRMVVGDDDTFGVVGVGDKWTATGFKWLSNSVSTDDDILGTDYERLIMPESVSFAKNTNGQWEATPIWPASSIVNGIDWDVQIPVAYKEFVPGASSAYESYRGFVKSWDRNQQSLKDDFNFEGTLTGKYVRGTRPEQGKITNHAATQQLTVNYTWVVEVYESGEHLQTLRYSVGYNYNYS